MTGIIMLSHARQCGVMLASAQQPAALVVLDYRLLRVEFQRPPPPCSKKRVWVARSDPHYEDQVMTAVPGAMSASGGAVR